MTTQAGLTTDGEPMARVAPTAETSDSPTAPAVVPAANAYSELPNVQPLPWSPVYRGGSWTVKDANDFSVCSAVTLEEATLISEAVNAHAALFAERDALRAALSELYATVNGECPSLLNEDSGGCARLAIEIEALLASEGK